MTTKATIAATAVACLLVGAGAGYVGASQFGSPQSGRPGAGGQGSGGNIQMMRGQDGQPSFGNMGGRVIGSVQSVADGRITVQTPDENSQIVLVNSSTSYQKMAEGSASDVTTGAQVIVMGEENPDGSTTANSIQIVPEGTNTFFGGSRPGGPGAGSPPNFNQRQ